MKSLFYIMKSQLDTQIIVILSATVGDKNTKVTGP